MPAAKHDWKAIKDKFIHSNLSLAEFADREGLNYPTVRKQAERHDWQHLKARVSQTVTERVTAKVVEAKVNELLEFNANDLKIAKALRGQVAAYITKVQKRETVLSVSELRTLASTAESVQRIGRLALGATTDNTGLSNPDGGPVATVATPGPTQETLEEIRKRLESEV